MRSSVPGELCCRFTFDDLRQVRQAALAWAREAGLGEDRAADFVLALNEVTSNAVRHGSPAAVLRLRLHGQDGVLAQVTDGGRWRPPAEAGTTEDDGQGLALVRLVCEQVIIEPSSTGTTVTLRTKRPAAGQQPSTGGGGNGWQRGTGCGGSGQRPA